MSESSETEQNPGVGQPYGGRDDKPAESGPAGTAAQPETVEAPVSADSGDENASRAATGGPMASDPPGSMQPTEGIPEQVDAPSPADATDGNPPGGSAANQGGRDPEA